jgi:putative transposase
LQRQAKVCRKKRSDVHAIYTLIAANQAELPVAAMCDHLEVSKSGYYDWHDRAPSQRTKANVTLLTQIEAAHALSDATYGMPRIRAELADQGVVASRKRIAAVMRRAHIRGVNRRHSYVVTATRDKRQRPAPDWVKRQFVATDVNQLWVADMTYVPTWAGLLYLAVVTDVLQPGLGIWRQYDG